MVTDPDRDLSFSTRLDIEPSRGQARDPQVAPATVEFTTDRTRPAVGHGRHPVQPVHQPGEHAGRDHGLLLVMAGVAFLVAVLVAAFLARRFTTPLTRLTEASRRLADGDLSSRVTTDEVSSSTTELRELSRQFNTMADRLEQSVAIIRRDRDYSRDFLADVSHELRTPIAAMRTFIELLQGPAGKDPAARTEFLDSSARPARAARLARPEPARALEARLGARAARPAPGRRPGHHRVGRRAAAAPRPSARASGSRRRCPTRPLRIRHDPPRLGQVVSNLVGNAVKFTEHGRIDVSATQLPDGGAQIEVVDTGVGIAESELPLIFDRFYRGSGANEARGTGSGLGPGDREVDRRHASRDDRGREPRRARVALRRSRLPRDPRDVPRSAARRRADRRSGRPAGRRRWTNLHRAGPRR